MNGIEYWRLKRHMSRRALAQKTGMIAESIKRYEKSIRETNSHQLIRLADALNVTIDELALEYSESELGPGDCRQPRYTKGTESMNAVGIFCRQHNITLPVYAKMTGKKSKQAAARTWEAQNLKPEDIEPLAQLDGISVDEFLVRYANPYTSQQKQRIIEYLKKHEKATYAELIRVLSLTEMRVKTLVRKMLKDGIIVRQKIDGLYLCSLNPLFAKKENPARMSSEALAEKSSDKASAPQVHAVMDRGVNKEAMGAIDFIKTAAATNNTDAFSIDALRAFLAPYVSTEVQAEKLQQVLHLTPEQSRAVIDALGIIAAFEADYMRRPPDEF